MIYATLVILPSREDFFTSRAAAWSCTTFRCSFSWGDAFHGIFFWTFTFLIIVTSVIGLLKITIYMFFELPFFFVFSKFSNNYKITFSYFKQLKNFRLRSLAAL